MGHLCDLKPVSLRSCHLFVYIAGFDVAVEVGLHVFVVISFGNVLMDYWGHVAFIPFCYANLQYRGPWVEKEPMESHRFPQIPESPETTPEPTRPHGDTMRSPWDSPSVIAAKPSATMLIHPAG